MKEKLCQTYHNSSDLIFKNVGDYLIIYLESINSSDKINDYILRPLESNNFNLIGPHIKKIFKKDIVYYLDNGFTIIFKKNYYAVETRANIYRSIDKPSIEPGIYGPKDAFIENIQVNLGLIKRRIKTPNLTNIDYTLGKITKTKVSLLYIEGLTDKNIVKKVQKKLENIDTNYILSVGNIHQELVNENKTSLPTMEETERPDKASLALMEGKIIILCDNSPFALIMPSFLFDFINPISDIYGKKKSINLLKILRLFCFITTLLLPALYIALINFNHETIPTNLLVAFMEGRDGVPFPSFIEAILMLITCGILRECDFIFPSSYGSAVSIVGALVLGEAAVKANIFSPIMIIIGAFTFITSMIFQDIAMVNSLRLYRFLFLIIAAFLGLYGLFIAISLFIMHLSSIDTLGKAYTSPLAPFNKSYFSKILFKIKNDKERKPSSLLVKK